MAEIGILNKQHPLYQEDRGGKYHYLCLGAQS